MLMTNAIARSPNFFPRFLMTVVITQRTKMSCQKNFGLLFYSIIMIPPLSYFRGLWQGDKRMNEKHMRHVSFIEYMVKIEIYTYA